MTAAGMTVSVVIPTWQRAPWLERCLKALEAQTRRPDEVIVVGRAEDTAAREVVARFAHLPARWVEVDRPGHVAPVRTGLEEARGEVVAFLDDDTEPEAGWLGALLQHFADSSLACVGGRVVTPGFRGKVHPDAGRIWWYGKHVGNVGALDGLRALEVHGVMECNWAWRADALRSLEFDPVLDFEDASMYGLDLCLQARRRGWKVLYEPRARVIHHVAPRDPALDRGDAARRWFAYSRNYTYIAMKHFRGLARWAFLAWWWLVGERASYGLLKGVFDLLVRGGKTIELWKASWAGKAAGLKAWAGR